MSGVGEYKTRKGNMSGPSLVGFLAPDTHNECPKKAARGKGYACKSALQDERNQPYPLVSSCTAASGGLSCLTH
jgi:hypothetical protein